MNRQTQVFIKQLNEIAYDRNSYEVFCDWLEMSLCAFANIRYFNQNEELNNRYKKVAEKYNDEQISKMAGLLGITAKALDEEMQDFLGEVYMCAEFGNSNLGQFFTPYSVCRASAQMLLGDIEEGKIITLAEPCVGGGAMVIAYAEELLLKGVNYQQYLYVDAMDLSFNSVCMAFIQFSLLGIPATVTHGNTISLEIFGTYETPQVGISLIKERLNSQKKYGVVSKKEIVPVVKENLITKEEPVIEQNLLFEEKKRVDYSKKTFTQLEFDF